MLHRSASISKFVLTLFVAAVISPDASGATDPANRLLDDQRNTARLKQLEAPPPSLLQHTPELGEAPGAIEETGPVLHSPDIKVSAHALISTSVLDATLAPYTSLDIGQARLSLLVRQLTARLVEAGWVTSRAVIKEINQAEGRIEIELVPGRIEAFHAGEGSANVLAHAIPLAEGDVLSIEALEQGVRQINRLRMFDARVNILPGSAPGQNIVEVNMSPGRAWRLAVGVDNQGQQNSGTGRARLQIHAENTLALLDDILVAYLRSERSEALLGSIAVPQGFNTWSATLSASQSSIVLNGFDYTTRSTTFALGFNRVVRLNREGQDAFDLTLLRARSARRYGGIGLKTDRTTVIRAAWNHLERGARHHMFVEPSISVGLSALDAIDDDDRLRNADTHHQFVKYGINAGLVAIAGPSVEYATQLQAQRSHVSLAGLEQIALGGLASVRGFREAVVSGDTGYALRQELRFPRAFGDAAPTLTPYLHLDAGSVWLVGNDRMSVSSVGIGLRHDSGGVIGEAVLSAPMRRTPLNDDHSWRLHLQLSCEF